MHRHKRRDFSTFTARVKAQSAFETCIDPGPQKLHFFLLQKDQKVITVEPGEQGFAFLMMDYIADDSESSFQIFSVYRYNKAVS